MDARSSASVYSSEIASVHHPAWPVFSEKAAICRLASPAHDGRALLWVCQRRVCGCVSSVMSSPGVHPCLLNHAPASCMLLFCNVSLGCVVCWSGVGWSLAFLCFKPSLYFAHFTSLLLFSCCYQKYSKVQQCSPHCPGPMLLYFSFGVLSDYSIR